VIIIRDILANIQGLLGLEALLLWGPRQVGKTTLLDQLALPTKIFFDDLHFREQANKDPAFLLLNITLPCLFDEVQYAANLFPEIKKRIDQERREKLKQENNSPVQVKYYLTGSNTTLLDEKIKESLAGRCHLLTLHGLSVKELFSHFHEIHLPHIFFRGGFPALYTNLALSVAHYLNDYIVSFIEKDIARSAGVEKISDFHSVLRLLAARTGQFLNVSELANTAGVDQKTVSHWISLLERNFIVTLVSPYHSNLSKRIVKMKKIYFNDVGLASRLQGHQDENILWNSPQAGALFETLVFSELIKTRDNYIKDWQIYTWRTKEKTEMDFILQSGRTHFFIEAKLGIQNAKPFPLDSEALKVFPGPHQKIVVTAGEKLTPLDQDTMAVPIHLLGQYLLGSRMN